MPETQLQRSSRKTNGEKNTFQNSTSFISIFFQGGNLKAYLPLRSGFELPRCSLLRNKMPFQEEDVRTRHRACHAYHATGSNKYQPLFYWQNFTRKRNLMSKIRKWSVSGGFQSPKVREKNTLATNLTKTTLDGASRQMLISFVRAKIRDDEHLGMARRWIPHKAVLQISQCV